MLFLGDMYIYIYPGIPTTNKTMGVNITYHCLPKGFNRPNWANHYFNGGGSLGYIYILYTSYSIPSMDAKPHPGCPAMFQKFFRATQGIPRLDFGERLSGFLR